MCHLNQTTSPKKPPKQVSGYRKSVLSKKKSRKVGSTYSGRLASPPCLCVSAVLVWRKKAAKRMGKVDKMRCGKSAHSAKAKEEGERRENCAKNS